MKRMQAVAFGLASSFIVTGPATFGKFSAAQACENYWVNPSTEETECFQDPQNLYQRSLYIDDQTFISDCLSAASEDSLEGLSEKFPRSFCECSYSELSSMPISTQQLLETATEESIFDIPEFSQLVWRCTFTAGRQDFQQLCIDALHAEPDMQQISAAFSQRYCQCSFQELSAFTLQNYTRYKPQDMDEIVNTPEMQRALEVCAAQSL